MLGVERYAVFVGCVAEELNDGALGLEVDLYHFLPAVDEGRISLRVGGGR